MNDFMESYIDFGDVYEIETKYDGTIICPTQCYEESNFPDEVSKERIGNVYYGRYSANGYLDCTSWHYAKTEEELLGILNEYYGKEEEVQDGK
jgi:hypothetical protein